MSRATDKKMDDLHDLVVEQAIRLMKYGRPLISNGEPVLDPEGEIIYIPPTAAELTAAARILKDNGIDSPLKSQEQLTAEEDAMRSIIKDIESIPTGEYVN